MRRVMLLALLALALPMAVSADQIRYNTGTPSQNAIPGSTYSADFPSSFSVDVTCPSCTPVSGSTEAEISLMDAALSGCPTAPGVCDLTGGELTVTPVNGGAVFTDSVTSGTIIRGTNTAVINADLSPTASLASGEVNFGLSFNDTSPFALTHANGSVILNTVVPTTVIPEPGTLGMLGTGLIGLAGVVRRKLKLPI